VNNSLKKLCLTSILSLTILSSGSFLTHASASVTTNPASVKNTALVTQSQVNADCLIKGNTRSHIRSELAKIQVGVIPSPLGELVIERKELKQKLGSLASELDLPEKVTIKRNGSILKGTDIKEKLQKICLHDLSGKIELDLSRIPRNVILPGNLISWNLIPNSSNKIGMRLFSLMAETKGGAFRQLVQVKVSKLVEAAQLTRLAKPGEVITKDMIIKKVKKINNDRVQPPVSYQTVLGKCLGRFKSPGTIIRTSDISKDPEKVCKSFKPATKSKPQRISRFAKKQDRDNWIVKPGERVKFNFRNGTLSLSFPAKAMQGGNEGDEITLINLKNKRRVKGIITAKGIVEYEN
jgi:flagella basal body P-ring formation protein FlgA